MKGAELAGFAELLSLADTLDPAQRGLLCLLSGDDRSWSPRTIGCLLLPHPKLEPQDCFQGPLIICGNWGFRVEKVHRGHV